MKLTANMKHELKMTRLGGDGMLVSHHYPLLRTYLALERRGYLSTVFVVHGETRFNITDAGRVVADKLIQQTTKQEHQP